MTSPARHGLDTKARSYLWTIPKGVAYDRHLNANGVRENMVKQVKVIVEKHSDGYVAYPLSLKGVVIGEGDTYEEALADVKSAISFHVETFGSEAFEGEFPVLEAFVAEAGVEI